MMTVVGTQIDSDKRLLQFNSYEDYLDSLITCADLRFVEVIVVARQLAELGYRSTGETLSREAFNRRWQIVKDLLYPIHRPYELTSEFTQPTSSLMQELALRERFNRLRVISTIIFIRNFTKRQFEVSGYIDFYARLQSEDWLPYFEGRKKIWPRTTDLSYYYWRTGKSYLNDSPNYEPVTDPIRGLLFKNIHDKRYVNVDPAAAAPGIGTSRIRVRCPQYQHVILYDHIVRSKS